MQLLKIFSFLLAFASITSCNGPKSLRNKEVKFDTEESMVLATELYKQGLDELKAENYKEAAKVFEKLYFEHPGHQITPYAELMHAYSLYKGRAYEDAGDILDEFIALHPLNSNLAYAYYLRFLTAYMNIVDVTRDQSITKQAKLLAINCINRFPNSEYAADIKDKLKVIDENLAGYEMEIGKFYLNHSSVIAAASHFNTIVSEYKNTNYYPEALARLVEVYEILGLHDEAIKYGAVLHQQYPNSLWYEHANKLILQHSAKVN